MFIVTKKPLTPNILWDEKSGSVLCKFINGKLETDDKKLASKLEKLGYQIEEVKEPEAPEAPEKPEEPDEGKSSEGEKPKTRRNRK